MKKIKALVVDDSAYNRMTITQMLAADAGIEVVGSAHDGVDAIAKTLRLAPDVITLDLEMPNMDGFTFLRWLMKERPTPVLVLSSRSDSRSVFRALELGAVDFLAKPEARISKSIESVRSELVVKVQSVVNLEMSKVKSAIALLAGEKTAAPPARKMTPGSRRARSRWWRLPRQPAGRPPSRPSSPPFPRISERQSWSHSICPQVSPRALRNG